MLGAPALGTVDPEILIWCEENVFILVANNRKSMRVHLQGHLATGRRAAGILILNAEMSVGETFVKLVLRPTASSAKEYQGQIIYLPIS